MLSIAAATDFGLVSMTLTVRRHVNYALCPDDFYSQSTLYLVRSMVSSSLEDTWSGAIRSFTLSPTFRAHTHFHTLSK